jgi:hypothetical protein
VLLPELDVTALERDGIELMIQEAAGPGRRFRTAPLELPCGRGVNFQLRFEDVDAMHARAVEAGVNIIVPIEEPWYRVDVVDSGGRWQAKGPTEAGNRQFVSHCASPTVAAPRCDRPGEPHATRHAATR